MQDVTLTLPMLDDMELTASKTACAMGEHIRMSQDKIDEIQAAVIEATINAFEHSAAPDQKVSIHFHVLGADNEPQGLQITVRDAGVGIPENKMPKAEDDAKPAALPKKLTLPQKRGFGLKIINGLMEARVIVNTGSFERTWPAKVAGVRESLDTETRALRLTVVVDLSPENFMAKEGPPLCRGSFCKVEIRSRTRDAIVIPRFAVRDGDVFWLDAESRLRRSSIDVEFNQGEMAVVRGGIKPGVKLVVSDPTPAIEGLLVKPVFDEKLAAALACEASAGTVQ